jgi:hypothetical protein
VRRLLGRPVALAAALAGALLLVMAADARPASAHHEEYLATEAAYPYGGSFTHQVGNRLMRKWWARQAVTWNSNTTALPGQGDLDDHARAAITAWQALDSARFADTVWTEVGLGTDADVEFRYTGFLCDPDPACVILHPTNYATEDAYYLTAAEIWLTDDAIRSPNGLLSDVAHEIGHVYGLGENYRHESSHATPLGATSSIMNGGVAYFSGAWGTGSTCPAPATACLQGGYYPPSPTTQGVLLPTAEDAADLKALWRGQPAWAGSYPNTRHSGITKAEGVHRFGGYLVALVWTDFAWAERYQILWYDKLNPDGVTTTAVYQYVNTWREGRHYDYAASTHQVHALNGDLTAWGPGQYRACAIPIFQAASPDPGGEFGQVTTCSAFVTLPL